jgi:O-antigen ligase
VSRIKPPLNAEQPYPRMRTEIAPPLRISPAVSAVATEYPAPPQAASPEAAPRQVGFADNIIRKLAFYSMLGFIFVRFTFLHEILGMTLNVRSYLPPLFGIPTVLGLVLSGRLAYVLRHRPVYAWIGFFGCMVLSIPTSVWPGATVETVWRYFQSDFPMLFMIAGLTLSWRDLTRVFYSLALAGVVNELTAKYFSREIGGRLQLTAVVTAGNANDYAAHMLLILPIFIYLLFSPGSAKLLRFISFFAIPACLFFSLRTGSRGGFIAMFAGYVFFVIAAKGMQKIAALVIVPVLMIGLFAAMPGEVFDRLSSITDSSAESQEAATSATGRKRLLMRGIELTFERPFFGHGAGLFAISEGASRNGEVTGQWMAPHNSYTQVSSENGIPALIFLLVALGSGFMICRKVRREALVRGHTELAGAAFAVMGSYVIFCSAAFFLSMAYRFYFPVLGGLSTALYLVAQSELRQLPPATVKR